MLKLKKTEKLHQSSIVANCLMNRERGLSGGNSYEKELSFGILEFLEQSLKNQKNVRWLDICCGSGKALIEAAEKINAKNIKITGIDLVGMFDEIPQNNNSLKLIESSFENFNATNKFDLITCVHGLHYIGDKLKFIQDCISNLKPNGIFLANLDFANFKFQNEKSADREIIKSLRNCGLEYNARKHLLICNGRKEVNLNYKYLGANDNAGANYTKQAVIDSYYKI